MVENVTSGASARDARVVLFDFDGTLSLIRSGWMNVMVPMMVEILADLKSGETEAELQMMAFADAIQTRGGRPLDPLVYKKMYLDLLWQKIEKRVEGLRQGQTDPEEFLVPGSRALLERLREKGLKMYLASGTDEIYMKEEARLLGVTPYFDGGVYGAQDDYKSSKAILIQRILRTTDFQGHQFLVFGDGYVEIEEVKNVGGVAVGVASQEPSCQRVDEWKRERLIGVGADYIVPNYLCREELFSSLFPV